MSLKIDLKPGEKFIINGAVLTAGKRRVSLVLENQAVLLRSKDIMQEKEADTPAKRIYFAIMLMYIGNGEPAYRERFLHRKAMAACSRKELSALDLSDALAHRKGWDPKRHPVDQEVVLRRAIRESCSCWVRPNRTRSVRP